MKNFIAIAIALAFTSPVLAQKTPVGVTYDTTIVRAIDGDTIVITAPYLPAPLKPELGVRIFGVDTPEKSFRAKCASEKARGEQASVFVKDLIAGTKKQQVVLYDWDKFGGRVLGDILLDGMSLRDLLIKNGFARAYFGDAKQSWCN
jgi:endonuclease YncB( thermonuclease family)